MRELIREFVRFASETLPIEEPIYEFGAYQVAGQEEYANLRPFFPGKKYIGCDIRQGAGVDLVLDLHKIDLPSNTAGSVLILDTLQHVEYCHRALEESHRILNNNGIVIITSVFVSYNINPYPWDFWRFTPEGMNSLLKLFSKTFVGYAGEEKAPHTVVGIGFKGVAPNMDDFLARYDKWQSKWKDMSGKSVVPVTFNVPVPQAVKNIYRKFRASGKDIKR